MEIRVEEFNNNQDGLMAIQAEEEKNDETKRTGRNEERGLRQANKGKWSVQGKQALK